MTNEKLDETTYTWKKYSLLLLLLLHIFKVPFLGDFLEQHVWNITNLSAWIYM